VYPASKKHDAWSTYYTSLAPTVRRCGGPPSKGAVGAVLLAAHEVATFLALVQ
jgi:hypothetical protein